MKKIANKKVIFAVYGTLKKGFHNHSRLDKPSVKFLGAFETEPKFTMTSVGGFPAVYCNGNTSIKTELYETEDPSVINSVNALEGYSGTPGPHNRFYDVEFIETPHGTASMFVFRGAIKYPVVESGEWMKSINRYSF